MHGVDGVGGGDERLGGDAATVETCAAYGGVTLDECHFHAEFGGAQGRGIAAGPAPMMTRSNCSLMIASLIHISMAPTLGSHMRLSPPLRPKNSPLDCFLYGSAPQRGEPEYIWTISPPASDRASGNAAWEAPTTHLNRTAPSVGEGAGALGHGPFAVLGDELGLELAHISHTSMITAIR